MSSAVSRRKRRHSPTYGLRGGGSRGGYGARCALAAHGADEHEVGAVYALAFLAAPAGGGAAFHVAVDQGAGAQVAGVGQLTEDALASDLQGGDVVGSRQGGLPFL